MSVLKTLIIILAVAAHMAGAQDAPKTVALTFQDWKQFQVLEAQNQVLRTGSKLTQIKAKKPAGPEVKDGASPTPTGSARVKMVSESDNLAVAERDLRRAQESLETANSLTVNDYISIYLPTLQNQPEALSQLSEKLSKEELAELFKGLVARPAKPDDAKRSGKNSVLSGVTLSSNK